MWRRKKRCGMVLVVAVLLFIAICYLESQCTNTIRYVSRQQATKEDAGDLVGDRKIPRIIHQLQKVTSDSDFPAEWQSTYSSVKELHKRYVRIIWTPESIRHFLNSSYPWFFPTYDGYQHPVQKLDAFRLFALYHFGGIYVDLDVGARRPFDSLLNFDLVLAKSRTVGFSNELMASVPKHPFLRKLIKALVFTTKRSYSSPILTAMLTSGPLFVTEQYHMSNPLIVKDVVAIDYDTLTCEHGWVYHADEHSWQMDSEEMALRFWYRHSDRYFLALFVRLGILLCITVVVFVLCILLLARNPQASSFLRRLFRTRGRFVSKHPAVKVTDFTAKQFDFR